MRLSISNSTTRPEASLSLLLGSLLDVPLLLEDVWVTLVPSFLVEKVRIHLCIVLHYLTQIIVGAASDKVAALQKAGVIVTDSPAKIGAEMLKVSLSIFSLSTRAHPPLFPGNEGGRFGLDFADQ